MTQPDLDGARAPGGFTLPMLARLAKLVVLFVPPADPPSPSALVTLGGVVHAVAWTDLEVARASLQPGERLVQAAAAELATALPPGVGLLLDPRSAEPMVVPPESIALLIEARRDFPAGHQVVIGVRDPEPTALYDAWRVLLDADPAELTQARAFWKQVQGQDGELLVVLEGTDDPVARMQRWVPVLFPVITAQALPFAVSLTPLPTDPNHPLVENYSVGDEFWHRPAE